MNKDEIVRYIKRWLKEHGNINVVRKYDIKEGVERKLSSDFPFCDWKYVVCLDKQNHTNGYHIDMDEILPSLYSEGSYKLKTKLYLVFYNFLKYNYCDKAFINNIDKKYLIKKHIDDTSKIKTIRDFVFNFTGSPLDLIRYSFTWNEVPCGTALMWQDMHIKWFNFLRYNIINGTTENNKNN